MGAQAVELPWGREQLRLELPGDWRVEGVLAPAPLPAVRDVAAAVEEGLRAPIGTPALAELAAPGGRVAVVIDDGSRPTPVAKLLPAVLAELERGGAARGRITLVVALGLHRPMTAAEVEARAGPLDGIRWENHDCDDPERLVELGRTSRGTRVLVNRTVAESDLVVCIGCIEPHVIAGFGGGAKMLVPGVAGRETIGQNHALHCTPARSTALAGPARRARCGSTSRRPRRCSRRRSSSSTRC